MPILRDLKMVHFFKRRHAVSRLDVSEGPAEAFQRSNLSGPLVTRASAEKEKAK